MRFFKRLMEIKEEQLKIEKVESSRLFLINHNLTEILKVLKGGVKNGNNSKVRRRGTQSKRN